MRFSQKRDILIFITSLALLARFGLSDETIFYAVYDYQGAAVDPNALGAPPRPGAFYNVDEGAWFGPYSKQSTNKHELCQWWGELEHKHSRWAHGYSLPPGDTIRVAKTFTASSSVNCYFEIDTRASGWQAVSRPGRLQLLRYSAILPHPIPQKICATKQESTQPPEAAGLALQHDNLPVEGQPDPNARSTTRQSPPKGPPKPDELRWAETLVYADKSQDYPSKSAACQQGLAEFKTRASSADLLHTLTADYRQDTCFLTRGDQIIYALGIAENMPYGNSTPAGLLQLKQQDGSITPYYRKPSADYYEVAGGCSNDLIRVKQGLARLSSANEHKLFDRHGKLIETYSRAGQLRYRYEYNDRGELIAIKNGLKQ